jgi:NAD(P)-dependent dehydrogenase (short-subunit alcohol dehydrogenase family)
LSKRDPSSINEESKHMTTPSQPVAVIVGFGAGNGTGIAHAFAEAGFALSLISRNPTKYDEAIRPLHAPGRTVHAFAADADALTGALNQSERALGIPAVLIYNAMWSGAGGGLATS